MLIISEEEILAIPIEEGAEEEEMEEESEEMQDYTNHPKIEWILTNSSWKVEIRIWDPDRKALDLAFQMMDKSLKVIKGR